MTVTAVDTSVVIAALLAWHESHEPALDSMIAARHGGLVLPAPALTEAYSVMTRLPAPHRLAPADACELLSGSFERRARVVALTEKDGVVGSPTRSPRVVCRTERDRGTATHRDALELAARLRKETQPLSVSGEERVPCPFTSRHESRVHLVHWA